MVSGNLVVDNGKSVIGARPGQPIRYEAIPKKVQELDLQDKKYQWHKDLPEMKNAHRMMKKVSAVQQNRTFVKTGAIDGHSHADGLHSLACELHYSPAQSASLISQKGGTVTALTGGKLLLAQQHSKRKRAVQ